MKPPRSPILSLLLGLAVLDVVVGVLALGVALYAEGNVANVSENILIGAAALMPVLGLAYATATLAHPPSMRRSSHLNLLALFCFFDIPLLGVCALGTGLAQMEGLSRLLFALAIASAGMFVGLVALGILSGRAGSSEAGG